MTKREELYLKLGNIPNDGYLIEGLDALLDTNEKVEEMLKDFDEGRLKTSDDVIEKILEFEYGYEAVHGPKKWLKNDR